jgi:N-formylglutamate amidohydrolase
MDAIEPWAYRRHLEEDGGPLASRTARDAATVDLEQPSPIIGVAVHHSHRVREELAKRMAIDPADRRYEEDPHTHRFLRATTHRITPNQSRYEVDMNRPPNTAIYLTPDMAWGATVWDEPPTSEQTEQTLERWYEFHATLDAAIQHAIHTHGRAVVLDLHSYNYQRGGPVGWQEDDDPVVNLGTRHLELDERGRELKEAFLDDLHDITVLGEEALVEENSVFYGGYLNRRLSRTYGEDCLTLSVEFKKVFMDERTGEAHEDVLDDLLDQFDDVVRRLADRVDAPALDEPRDPVTVGS